MTGERAGASPPQAPQPGLPAPQGWASVVSVTPQWIVIQNANGQQMPVSVGMINLFLIRWPTSPDQISPTALVEVTGMDIGSNRIRTDHADVYEGAARTLVSPTFLMIGGNGAIQRQIDFTFNQDAYGEPFPGLGRPLHGGVMTGPSQLHMVGPLVNRIPLQVAISGNNAITVLPIFGGLSLTSITRGSVGFVRPGDMVYYVTDAFTPKSLRLNQLIVYKRIPLSQFAP